MSNNSAQKAKSAILSQTAQMYTKVHTIANPKECPTAQVREQPGAMEKAQKNEPKRVALPVQK
jgi:hypothetical protein